MQLLTFADADAFLERTRTCLEREEAFNNVPLGLAFRLRERGPGEAPTFLAAVEEGANPALAALMTPARKLILYSDRADPDPALEVLARHLAASSWTVPGTIGPVDQATRFAQIWEGLTGCTHTLHMKMRAYELRRVECAGRAPGRLRPAGEGDMDLACAWIRAFNQDVGERASPEEVRQQVGDKIARRELFLWEDGEPVSIAGQSRPTRRGVVVNAVYTPPALRGRGYATCCVAALSQHLLDGGRLFCALFTDLANPTSNHIYQRIGYRPRGDLVDLDFSARA